MLCNVTRRLGDVKRVTLHQRVRGSIRAVRAVQNTRVFLTETRVVADVFAQTGEPLLWMVHPEVCHARFHKVHHKEMQLNEHRV